MSPQRAVIGAREGQYGCTRGPIMGFESRAILARVTKQIVTIFSKTCDNLYINISILLVKSFDIRDWLIL